MFPNRLHCILEQEKTIMTLFHGVNNLNTEIFGFRQTQKKKPMSSRVVRSEQLCRTNSSKSGRQPEVSSNDGPPIWRFYGNLELDDKMVWLEMQTRQNSINLKKI